MRILQMIIEMSLSHKTALALVTFKALLARMYQIVSVKVMLQTELFVAFVALKRLNARVNARMSSIIAQLVEALVAYFTLEQLFARVNAIVDFQMRLGYKFLAALIAFKLFILIVHLQVVLQVTVAQKSPRAQVTLEWLAIAVTFSVQIQAAFRREILVAQLAGERFFARVRAYMIFQRLLLIKVFVTHLTLKRLVLLDMSATMHVVVTALIELAVADVALERLRLASVRFQMGR